MVSWRSCNSCQDSGEEPLMQRRLGSGAIQKLRCGSESFIEYSPRVNEMESRNPHQDFTTRMEWKGMEKEIQVVYLVRLRLPPWRPGVGGPGSEARGCDIAIRFLNFPNFR